MILVLLLIMVLLMKKIIFGITNTIMIIFSQHLFFNIVADCDSFTLQTVTKTLFITEISTLVNFDYDNTNYY